MAPAEATRARLERVLDPAWIAGQRWFRSKQRAIAAVEAHELVALARGTWLAVLAVHYADGGEERYLVPLVDAGDGVREPDDGDGTWRLLAHLVIRGAEIPGERGAFTFAPLPVAAASGPADLVERRLRVEQSNTSVVLGDRLILKLYRLLEPGENPDVEVAAFLTAAGFADTPALVGSAAYLPDDGASCAAAMLQEFLPSDGDGWRWALDALAAGESGDELVGGAEAIGALTARLHAALASRPADPAFPARTATLAERAAWRTGAEQQLDAALEAVRGGDRDRLAGLASSIRERLSVLERGGDARATRIHGDYHLGQLLRTGSGFAVIDFEGEPARPIAERRRPASPLRDVAGMLRSLDYAVRTAERQGARAAGSPDDLLERARAAFVSGYGGLPPAEAPLVAALELEKACYEVRYEANNRPDWTWLPLAALERLAA